jgi:hypothetical protein
MVDFGCKLHYIWMDKTSLSFVDPFIVIRQAIKTHFCITDIFQTLSSKTTLFFLNIHFLAAIDWKSMLLVLDFFQLGMNIMAKAINKVA